MLRYLRLYAAFLRIGLVQEMSFRGNFLIRVGTELVWFALLVVFYEVIYSKTNSVATWSKFEYLVLVGTHFIATGIVETFFMPNCSELAEKVRTGKLDFALAKPVDEQFLLTLQNIDWATATNIVYGSGMVIYSLAQLGARPSAFESLVYALTLVCGVAIFYSLMIMISVTAVWLIRNQNVYEMWFYVNVFGRFPPEMFSGPLGNALRRLLTYMVPVLIAVSVPASVLTERLLSPGMAVVSVAAALGLLVLSRGVFRWSLAHYRSASS